jgi:uncharacterized protein YggE
VPSQDGGAEPPRERVTVIGSGTAEAVPDVLVAAFGSETRAGTVSEALDGSVRSLAELIATLRAGGVDDLDLVTGSASVWPMADDHGRVTGYAASQRLTARLRDLGRAGTLVGEAVVAGGDAARLHGLSFELSDTRLVNEWARVQAWQDARGKAGQLATLAGRMLGPVVRIRESGPMQPMHPMPLHAVEFAAAARPPSLPVEPGTTTVTVTIEVEWAFLG